MWQSGSQLVGRNIKGNDGDDTIPTTIEVAGWVTGTRTAAQRRRPQVNLIRQRTARPGREHARPGRGRRQQRAEQRDEDDTTTIASPPPHPAYRSASPSAADDRLEALTSAHDVNNTDRHALPTWRACQRWRTSPGSTSASWRPPEAAQSRRRRGGGCRSLTPWRTPLLWSSAIVLLVLSSFTHPGKSISSTFLLLLIAIISSNPHVLESLT